MYLSDPATIDNLPDIPNGFLELMGISSAGYLGGKLARKGGPILSGVVAAMQSGNLVLDITGAGLSQNATFTIGNEPVSPVQILGDKNLPEIVQVDPTSAEPGTARQLKLMISNPKPSWLGEKVRFTFTNPDKQASVAEYSVTQVNSQSSVNTASVSSATVSSTDPNFEIKGGPFENSSTVQFIQGNNSTDGSNVQIGDGGITGTVNGLQIGDVEIVITSSGKKTRYKTTVS